MPHACYHNQKKRIYNYDEKKYDEENEDEEFVNMNNIDDDALFWVAKWQGIGLRLKSKSEFLLMYIII